MAMNSDQIKLVLGRLCHGRRKLRGYKIQYGCIGSDILETLEIKGYPFALCVNDQPSWMKGSHWVGLYIEAPGRPLEFFCSFGRSMLTYPKYFNDFAVKNNLSYNQAPFDLQGLDSSFCGHHVIYFLYTRLRGISFSSFYFGYKRHTPYENDEKVKKFVDRVYSGKPYVTL